MERLGRGGMADVYKAYQPGMDRYVAIKVMHPHLAYDDDFVARFQREARSVANLHHPNIVQVFDFDVEDDETYYMVMEYVENGTSLKDMLQDLASEGKRLPLDMTLSIISKLADALDYAHSEGMVHRDIKPANILLPSTQRPLLSDFGIAKLMGQTGLTASGAMIGTPAYMSPEQGRGETADHRSDIYALGVVFYEMVLGRPPYDADTPYAIILKHINEPLISPRSMDASLPLSVERLCLRALSKDLDARFQSAGEMRAVANEALNELKETTAPGVLTPVVSIPPMGNDDKEAAHTLPVEPQPESTRLASSDGAETTRRLPRALWAVPAALVVIAIVAGAVILSPFGSSEPEPPSEEVVAEASALMDAAWDMLENTGNVSESIELVEEAVDTASSDPATLRRAAEFYIHLADFDAATDVVKTGLAADPQSAALRLLNGELALYGEAYAPETAEAEFQFAIENCGDDREVCARANALLAELYAFQTAD
ncbi:MAG: protein kinase [Anaerolineae bacterium]